MQTVVRTARAGFTDTDRVQTVNNGLDTRSANEGVPFHEITGS